MKMVKGKDIAIMAGTGGLTVAAAVALYEFHPKGYGMPTRAQEDAFALLGDIDRNGRINKADASIISAAFGSTPASSNWNPACDLNKDGVVDILDSTILANNFGKNIWDYFKIW